MSGQIRLSEDDIALLVEAAKIAMALAVQRRQLLEDGDVAAKLFDAFVKGERDPERLAQAVLDESTGTVH